MSWLPLLAPLSPLLLLAALGWSALRGSGSALSLLPAAVPWAALPAAAVALLAGGEPREVPWVGLGLTLGIDRLTAPFLTASALLWWGAGLHARRERKERREDFRFHALYLTAMGAHFSVLVSHDPFALLSGFVIMGLAAYALMMHGAGDGGRRAGTLFLPLMIVADVLLFEGFVLLALPAPDTALSSLLLLVGLGLKAGLFPLHLWLPLGFAALPVSVAAVIGVAMTHTALLGWVRFLPSANIPGVPPWGEALAWIGAIAVAFAVVVGITRRHPRAVAAYAVVAHGGVVAIVIAEGGAAASLPAHYLPLLVIAQGGLLLAIGPHAARRGGSGSPTAIGVVSICALFVAGLPAVHLAPFIGGAASIGIGLLMLRLTWLLRSPAGRRAATTSPSSGDDPLTRYDALFRYLSSLRGESTPHAMEHQHQEASALPSPRFSALMGWVGRMEAGLGRWPLGGALLIAVLAGLILLVLSNAG